VDTEVKLKILEAYHDRKMAEHLGQAKILELIVQDYTWPEMREFIKEYIRTYDTCIKNKIQCRNCHGQLLPLLIPSGPCKSVSIDFIM